MPVMIYGCETVFYIKRRSQATGFENLGKYLGPKGIRRMGSEEGNEENHSFYR